MLKKFLLLLNKKCFIYAICSANDINILRI
nr:MAG TPA: hypothetical protein [Inoviridae sp.]